MQQIDINKTIQRALALVGDQKIVSGVNINKARREETSEVRGNAHQLVDLRVNLLLFLRGSSLNLPTSRIKLSSRSTLSHEI